MTALPSATQRHTRWPLYTAAALAAFVLVLAAEVVPRSLDALSLLSEARALERQVASLERPGTRDAIDARADLAVGALAGGRTVADVLLEVQVAADDQGVQIRRISPGQPESGGLVPVLPIEIGVAGSFHDVARFLSALERAPYLVSRVRVEDAPGPNVVATFNAQTPLPNTP